MLKYFCAPKRLVLTAVTALCIAVAGLSLYAQTDNPRPVDPNPNRTVTTDSATDNGNQDTRRNPQDNAATPTGSDAGSGASRDDAAGAKTLKTIPPKPPANPLVAPIPQDNGPVTPIYLPAVEQPKSRNRSGIEDYRFQADGQNTKKSQDVLPLFGYDFFRPAREMILARRAYFRARYGTPSATTNTTRGNSNTRQPGDSRYQNGSLRPSNEDTRSSDRTTNSNSDTTRRDAQTDTQTGDNNTTGNRGANDDTASTDMTNPRRSDEPDTQYTNSSSTAPYGADTSAPRRDTSTDRRDTTSTGRDTTSTGRSTAADNSNYRRDNTTQTGPMETPAPADNTPANAYEQVVDPITMLFRNALASAPANYQLSAGDSVQLTYWSPTVEARTVKSTVDGQGALRIEDFSPIIVRGMTLTQAERAIVTQLRRYYKSVQATVSLGALRTIQITVSGEAFEPGAYLVPAGVSAFNMLYAAGGPTESGSLRNIQVRRNGAVVSTLDMYQFQLKGEKAGDLPLQAGDLIFVGPRESRVTVRGEVTRPAQYEMRPGETLKEVLDYAGNVKATGAEKRLQVTTVVPGQYRVLKDVDYRDAQQLSKTPVYDGDQVDVFSVRPILANRVTLEGAVDQPGNYALSPGMRVSDLLSGARGALPEANLMRADLFRYNPDNTTTLLPVNLDRAIAKDPAADLALTRWDRLHVYSREDVAWTGLRTVVVRGAVRKPGLYTRSLNMRVSDLLMQAGGPTEKAYLDRAVLLHQHGDGTFGYEFVNIAAASRGEVAQDPIVQDEDLLAVYRVGEAQFQPDHVVTISGDVVAPGVYPRGDRMTVSDLLKLAGGFKPGADTSVVVAHPRQNLDVPGGTVTVQTVNFDDQGRCLPADNVVLTDGDVAAVRGTGGFQSNVALVTVEGAVNHPGPIVLMNKNVRLSEVIKQAGGLRPEAFPEGAEFVRDPRLLTTVQQQNLASVITGLNDLLNKSALNREIAKSSLEMLRAVGAASAGSSPLAGITGAASPPPSAASDAAAGRIAASPPVSPARVLAAAELDPKGNIAVNVSEALRKPGSDDDIILAAGDKVTIPTLPTTIQVIGAVYNARSVLYKPGDRLDDYVAAAGGMTADAARDRVEVIHVGGGLIPAQKLKTLRPGDVILVPTKVLAEKISRSGGGISDFFKSLTTSAIVFRLATGLVGL